MRLPLTDSHLASLNLPIGFVAKKGAAPRVELTAVVAGRTVTWQGSLARVDAAVDHNTRLFYATAEVLNPYDMAVPLAVGLYVKADVYGDTLESALVVPRAALRAGNKIYVVNDKKRLDIRVVEVVDKTPERVVIRGAVQEGEDVVVSPVRNPGQGMVVNTMSRGGGGSEKIAAVKEAASNG